MAALVEGQRLRADDGVDGDLPVEVREELPARVGLELRVGHARRLVAQAAVDEARARDRQQHEVIAPGEEATQGVAHLRRRGQMHEAIALVER